MPQGPHHASTEPADRPAGSAGRRNLTIVSFALALALGLLIWWLPEFRYQQNVPLLGDIKHIEGHAYVVRVPHRIPSEENLWNNSPLVLLEDGRPLGPAHYRPNHTAMRGRGAYIHYRNRLIFSSSDNTDPRINNRSYTASIPAMLPLWMILLSALLTLLVITFVLFGISMRVAGRRSRRAIAVAGTLLTVAAGVELASKAILQHTLVSSGKLVESVYMHVFDKKGESDLSWRSLHFMPHHYLNYALNPEAVRNGKYPYNETYLIRRQEPIRDRHSLKWRALVIGGSTTFDAQILDEENTWVFELERRIRDTYGTDCDVINGGVGGYTVYENFVHYITLLTYLEPDVVILYVGINDVFPRTTGTLALDYRNFSRATWNADTATLKRNRSLLRLSQLYQLIVMHTQYRDLATQGIMEYTRMLNNKESSWPAQLQANSTVLYENIFNNFVTLLRGQGREVVVIPQYFRTTRHRPHDQAWQQGVEEHNRANRIVAERHNLSYLNAIEQTPPFEAGDLNDSCHFNEFGARKMANLVYEFLLSEQITPK